jgi:hemin uptake protein HemP
MNAASDSDAQNVAPQEVQPASGKQPQVSFTDLARGFREVIIEHQGQIYRLRVTRNEKLILQK